MFDGQNLPNDELEANDTSHEDSTQAEETATATEFETQQDDTSGGDAITLSRSELEEREREIRKEQDRRWKERIKGLEGKEGVQESREESGEKSEPQEGVASKEELDRFRLETKGIEDRAQQDFILKFAKYEGLSVTEAMNDDVVKAKIERLTADQEKARATQSPINRTGKPREKSPEELAKDWEAGKAPKTLEERRAARKALAQKYKAEY